MTYFHASDNGHRTPEKGSRNYTSTFIISGILCIHAGFAQPFYFAGHSQSLALIPWSLLDGAGVHHSERILLLLLLLWVGINSIVTFKSWDLHGWGTSTFGFVFSAHGGRVESPSLPSGI